MLSQAIETYHALLTPDVARESWDQLQAQTKQRGLYFGEREIATVLRPRFLTSEQYHFLQRAIHAVMPAFGKAYRAALADDALRAQFHLNDWEETVVREKFGFSEPSPSARMDTFYLPEQGILQLTEYNAEIPAGQTYTDVLSEVFYGLRVMGEFQKRYEVRPLPTRNQMLHALLDSYRQWGGSARPNIAILDWHEVPTYSEFVLYKEYFESQGYTAEIIDPRACEYKNGKLVANGFEINLVYKRVLISELVERGDLGLNHPVIRAVRDNAVCMVNPFACKILHKKASLAVLTDERNQHLYSAAEWDALQRFVPWTRVLEERKTTYNGATVDLMPFLASHKDEFVVKPNDEYGGKGIVLGWTVSQSEWEKLLQERLSEANIAQKRVALPEEPFPSFVDNTVQIYDRMLDTDPYLWHGAYMSGSLCRLSTAALLNVTAGGGSTVPTFVVEARNS
ncbi:MAG: hypothetical protein BroJett039_08020 [Chloroflexota bacterium]|nr:MAG: hypothetical protein BroJett039_08020 [Chloroflexota bacterium]